MMPEDSASRRKHKILLISLLVAGVVLAGLAAAVVVGLLFSVPVRQEITEVQESDVTTVSAEPETTAETPSAIENEAESVAFFIMTSSSGWAGHINDVETTTVLRRPVIVVSTDISSEQADLSAEVASALASFAGGLTAEDGSAYTYYFQILSSEGDLIGTFGATDDRWRLEAPAAPTGPTELRGWLDTVYGSGSPEPEAWAGRITSVTGGKDDTDGYVVVHTDLDPASLADQHAAQTIIDAVNSSGAAFAPGIRVVFTDGIFEWSSLLDGTDPYGPQ